MVPEGICGAYICSLQILLFIEQIHNTHSQLLSDHKKHTFFFATILSPYANNNTRVFSNIILCIQVRFIYTITLFIHLKYTAQGALVYTYKKPTEF